MMMPGQKQGMGQDPTATLNKMRSGFNPTDVAMGAQEGKFDSNQSVIEFLQANGVDPAGPVTQLKDMFMNQMKNADPLNKMRGLSQGGQAASAMPARPQGGDVGPQFDKLFQR